MNSPLTDLQERPTLIAIGNFDGVHRGHQAVLSDAASEARTRQLIPVALTFEPHPTVAVGRPPPACLTPVERKVELIRRLDPSLHVIVQHFDAEFAAQSPEQFVRKILVEKLHARAVRVGENFRFGAYRRGDIHTLMEFGTQFGFEAQSEQLIGDDDGRYSSTRARDAIAKGDLVTAQRMLGRPHALSGQVIEGQKRARSLGFPTANLAWVREALPAHGVYAVAVDRIEPDGHARRLGIGVCNIGVRPTVDAGFAVEAHVFNIDELLYGQSLRVHLLSFLRRERKFAGLVELKSQIASDCNEAQAVLATLKPAVDAGDAWF